jgi:hypothetical protein
MVPGSKKFFKSKKINIFFFKCLIFDCSRKFSFYNSAWIWIRIRIRTFFRIRIQPKLSDSFGFGSTTLVLAYMNTCTVHCTPPRLKWVLYSKCHSRQISHNSIIKKNIGAATGRLRLIFPEINPTLDSNFGHYYLWTIFFKCINIDSKSN